MSRELLQEQLQNLSKRRVQDEDLVSWRDNRWGTWPIFQQHFSQEIRCCQKQRLHPDFEKNPENLRAQPRFLESPKNLAEAVALIVVVVEDVVVAVVGIVVNVVAAADEVGGGDFENVKVFG